MKNNLKSKSKTNMDTVMALYEKGFEKLHIEPVYRIKLLKDPEGGFCMSVGSIIELYDGGFRNPEVNKNYYPVFGPYKELETIVRNITWGIAKKEVHEIFEVINVSDTITPTLEHDIMDEAGGMKICTVTHIHLMKLLERQRVDKKRGTEIFKLSNQIFKDDVIKYSKINIKSKKRYHNDNLEFLEKADLI